MSFTRFLRVVSFAVICTDVMLLYSRSAVPANPAAPADPNAEKLEKLQKQLDAMKADMANVQAEIDRLSENKAAPSPASSQALAGSQQRKPAEQSAASVLDTRQESGGGFDAPNWSLRVSLANLGDEVYEEIGRGVRSIARGYRDAFEASKRRAEEPGKRDTAAA